MTAIRKGGALRLSTSAQALAYAPGPDAGGVYRRPPDMPERLFVPPRDLIDGRWQPRETYDEQALAELTDSIREHGVLEDLIALVNEQGELELITGHRRKRAADAAGGRDVPVKVVEVTLPQATEIAIISNDQRSDLSDVERGRAYERMIQELGISEAELAKRLGRPRAYISQRRQVASAAPEVQQALVAGELSFSQARGICQGSAGDIKAQLATLKEAQKEKAAGRVLSGEAAQRTAEKAVRLTQADALKALGWKQADWWGKDGATRVYWYADRQAPAEWSSSEILAAVREGRRPPPAEGAAPVSLAAADVAALEGVDWDVDRQRAAPWVMIRRDKEMLAGDAVSLRAQIDAAHLALFDVRARFTALGWELRPRSGGASNWLATPPTLEADGKKKAKKAKKPEPIGVYGWRGLNKLLSQVEGGTWQPERGSSSSHQATCVRCDKKTSSPQWWSGGYHCPACVDAVQAKEKVEQAEIARRVDALLGAWLDAAPPEATALLLRDNRGQAESLRNLFGMLAWRYRSEMTLPPAEGATAVAPSQEEPAAPADQTLSAIADLMRQGNWQEAYAQARMSGRHYQQAMAAVDALVEGKPLEQALALLDPAPASAPADTEASDLHARVAAAAGGGAVPFGDLLDWMGQIELRWAAMPPAAIDEHTIERIAELLQELADDESIPDADYEAAEVRLDNLADQLAGRAT